MSSVVLLATSNTNDNGQNNYHPERDLAGFFGIIFSLVLLICPIKCFLSKEQKIKKASRDKMKVIINEANAYYNTVGLRWRLPPDHFDWIELWLVYRIAQYSDFGMRQNMQI